MRLSEVELNKWYVIENILETDEILKQRLYDLGVTVNAKIRVIRRAPVGDPIEIEVKNYYLSLRVESAKNISVKGVI